MSSNRTFALSLSSFLWALMSRTSWLYLSRRSLFFCASSTNSRVWLFKVFRSRANLLAFAFSSFRRFLCSSGLGKGFLSLFHQVIQHALPTPHQIVLPGEAHICLCEISGITGTLYGLPDPKEYVLCIQDAGRKTSEKILSAEFREDSASKSLFDTLFMMFNSRYRGNTIPAECRPHSPSEGLVECTIF